MRVYNFRDNIEIAYCLTPFHFIQYFLLHKREKEAYVLISNYEKYINFFGSFSEITFLPIEERKLFYKDLKKTINRFKDISYFYAVPWNKTALKIEKLVLSVGGKVSILEDGLGNYNFEYQLNPKKGLYYYLHKISYFFIGVNYCETHYEKYLKIKDKDNIQFYSVLPNRIKSGIGMQCKNIPRDNLIYLLNDLEKNFSNINIYKGKSVFFDSNDAEHNWINIEKKVEVLKNIFGKEEILYLPHPFQKYNLTNYISNLIDVSNETLGFNELFTYFVNPSKIYTIGSTALFTLKHIFNLNSKFIILGNIFYDETGDKRYKNMYENLTCLLR